MSMENARVIELEYVPVESATEERERAQAIRRFSDVLESSALDARQIEELAELVEAESFE